MNSMNAQTSNMVHEALDERQHIRIGIPARIILSTDGEQCEAELMDLSVGGFSFKPSGRLCNLTTGTLLNAVIQIDLTAIKLDVAAQVRITGARDGIYGAEFTEINLRTQDVLRYLISSFLAGDMATVDGVFTVLQRENQIKQRKKQDVAVRSLKDRLKAVTGTLFYLVASLLVAALLLNQLYLYLFRVPAVQAEVSGNAFVINMPENGYVSFLTRPGQQEVRAGEALASISNQLNTRFNTAADLQALQTISQSDLQTLMNKAFVETLISSPCDCDLHFTTPATDRFAYKFDNLVHLLPKDQPLTVTATIPFNRIDDINEIDRIRLQVLGSAGIFSGRVEKATVDAQSGTVKLVITPDQPLARSDYLKPVRVEIFKPLPGKFLAAVFS